MIRGLALAALLVASGACKRKSSSSPAEDLPVPERAPVVPLVDDAANDAAEYAVEEVPDAASEMTPIVGTPENCIPYNSIPLTVDLAQRRVCIDGTGNGEATDRCVRWSAAGKVLGIEPLVEVAAGSGSAGSSATADPIDDEHEQERISTEDTTVEVCPPDRACVKLSPTLGEDSRIDSVVHDATYHSVAVLVDDESNHKAHVELWDVVKGTRLATLPITGPASVDSTFAVQAHYGGVLITVVSDDGDRATLVGFDGKPRGALGNGSKSLVLDSETHLAGVDVELEDLSPKPYALYFHDSLTGKLLGKASVLRDEDEDDDLTIHPVSPTILAYAQLDNYDSVSFAFVDVRTRKVTSLVVPACH